MGGSTPSELLAGCADEFVALFQTIIIKKRNPCRRPLHDIEFHAESGT